MIIQRSRIYIGIKVTVNRKLELDLLHCVPLLMIYGLDVESSLHMCNDNGVIW